ncbi:helix-turn-helix transcriptional regulator [Nocardia panacis]|uniref:helix-turn-helix transcriptional regulator n=1 Tax=Nocardia panacis TaxID=2340916 RepID=UPI0013152E9F|nr:LuxR family transcriptional regulator [Nocardia panacis]
MRIDPFVGRAHELTTLDAAYREPGSRVFLVEGPAGIGKSRLLTEFVRRARGLRTISVAATEYEQSTPRHLLLEIACALEVEPGVDTRDSVRRLRIALGSTPTALVVDDVHWADAQSLRVLAALLPRLPESACAVLAYRQEQLPAFGSALREVSYIAVPPLTAAEASALLPDVPPARRARLIEAAHGNPLYLQLLAELAPEDLDAAVRADDPALGRADHAALDRTIRAELANLPPRERLVAQAAAVCGATDNIELLCATAEVEATELSPAVDELARRGWMTVTGGTVAFRHPLIRTAAYRLAGPAWRAAAHGRAARMLRASDAPLLTRARHLEHALGGRDLLASAELLRAAEYALATAPATSARWIDAALRATPYRDETAQILHGQALLLSGSADKAREVLEPLLPNDDSSSRAPTEGAESSDAADRIDAAERLEPAGRDEVAEPVDVADPLDGRKVADRLGAAERAPVADRIQVADRVRATDGAAARSAAVLLYARCERILGRIDCARDLLAGDIARLGAGESGPAQLELAILELQDNNDDAAGARIGSLFESGAVRDPAIRAAALTLRSMGHLNRLELASAIADYRAAKREFARLTDTQLLDGIHAIAALGWMSYFLDDQRTGRAHIERAIDVGRRRGHSFILPELHAVHAYCLSKLGHYEQAMAAAEDAAETAVLYGYPGVAPLAGAMKLRILEETAPPEEVMGWWRTLDALPRPAMGWWRAVVDAALAEVASRFGNVFPGQAPEFDPMPHAAHPMQVVGFAVIAFRTVTLGDLDAAAAMVTWATEAADQLNLPWPQAEAARARAEYLCARGDLEGAQRAIEVAISAYAQAEMPVFRARAMLPAARIAGQRGDFATATALIAAARTEFAAVGAHQLINAATALQRRLAGHRSVSGATTLSEREREVAELAAGGLSNKDIAGRLYLSPRTVEDHLGRILRKLGLKGRAGIAHRLAELDSA